MSTITERVVKRQRPFWQVILVIIGLVISINSLITLCNMLGEKYAGIASVIVLLSSMAACALLIMKFISNYIYKLSHDRLIVERAIGKRNNVLLDLEISKIESIKPIDELVKDKNIEHIYKFVFDKKEENVVFGEFTRDEKKYRFVFKPSQRMLKILNNKIKDQEVI